MAKGRLPVCFLVPHGPSLRPVKGGRGDLPEKGLSSGVRAGEATGRPVLSLQRPILIPTCPQPSRRQALPSRSKERGPAAREAGSGRQVSISFKSPRRLPHPRPWQWDAAIGLPVAPLFRTECRSLQCWSLPLWDGWAAWPEIARTSRMLGPQWGKKKKITVLLMTGCAYLEPSVLQTLTEVTESFPGMRKQTSDQQGYAQGERRDCQTGKGVERAASWECSLPCESLAFTSHELPLSEDVGPLGKVLEAIKCLAQTSLCRRCELLGNSRMGVT